MIAKPERLAQVNVCPATYMPLPIKGENRDRGRIARWHSWHSDYDCAQIPPRSGGRPPRRPARNLKFGSPQTMQRRRSRSP